MFKKILIANRGEIACRIMRTANRMGVECVAVFSEADRNAMHVRMAQEAICVGSAASADSYLRVDRVLDAAQKSGAQAIHPGYGFLSENAAFADAVRVAGLSFIGPPAQAMRDMGAKDASKRLMEEAEVPLLPGYHGVDQSLETLRLRVERQAATALQVASWLEDQPGVHWVRHPFLPSHPQHALATRQMSGGGPKCCTMELRPVRATELRPVRATELRPVRATELRP